MVVTEEAEPDESSTDSQHILQGSSNEPHATTSDGVCKICNMEVEVDTLVIESFIAVDQEGYIRIKQENAEDITFPDIKAEPDEKPSLSGFLASDKAQLPS